MKKLSFYIMALVAIVFTSCGDDYSTSIPPQSNLPESALKPDAITFKATQISSINLQQLIAEDKPIELGAVAIADGAMPKNTIMKARIDIAKSADFSDAYTVDCESMAATDQITILPSNLQAAYYNNFTHNPNETPLNIRIHLYTVTDGTSEAIVGTPGENYYGNYAVTFTPVNEDNRFIDAAYYAVVMGLDGKWAESKFEHAETDVYDDPVFTLSIDALKDDANVRHDTKFYVVAEKDLANFKAGIIKLGFGKGEGEGMAQGGAAFVGPSNDGASKYNLTINMEKQTIVIEPIVQFYCYYLYTNPAFNMKIEGTDTYENYMLYKSDETIFSYTTFWPNNANGSSQYNFRIWERKAMLVKDINNVWGKDGKKAGMLKQGNTSKWMGPEAEGWYTLTVTMDEENNVHTYQWTAVTTPTTEYTNISVVGTINGSNWDKDFDLTQCAKAPHNWALLGLELTADAKLKFRANHADTKVWGGDGSQPINPVVYTLPTGSKDIEVPAGTYNFYLNDITGEWNILKVK